MRAIRKMITFILSFCVIVCGSIWAAVTYGAPNAPDQAGQSHHWVGFWPTTTHARFDGDGRWTIFCNPMAESCASRARHICPNGRQTMVHDADFPQAIARERVLIFGSANSLSFRPAGAEETVTYYASMALDCNQQAAPQ